MTFQPTEEQRAMLDRNLKVSNYTYNKTVTLINNSKGQKLSKFTLRDQLVTVSTRKGCELFNKVSNAKLKISNVIKTLLKTRKLKNVVRAFIIKQKIWRVVKAWYDFIKESTPPVSNQTLKPFEIAIHKDIRANAVFECYTNYTNCMNAVKSGRIRFFKLKYRSRRKNKWSMGITKTMIKIDNGNLRFTDSSLTDKRIRFANRTRKLLRNVTEIKDSTITKENGVYKLRLPVVITIPQNIEIKKVVGIDPGVSTFLNMFCPEQTVTIKQSEEIKSIDKLRKRIKKLRKSKQRKRIRRSMLCKLDKRLANIVDELHWKSITYIVNNYDLIFLEKFESHSTVKGGKNKHTNRNTNNLKHYKFRERLMYKAKSLSKIVSLVNAHHTTKTCSSCGTLKDMKLSDRTYDCSVCNLTFNRDFNAGKNMILKGMC